MKSYNPRVHHRRSIRLPAYNYRTPGAYFVTICTFQKECTLEDKAIARIVNWAWNNVMSRSTERRGDAFVVMPNHVHGIIWITGRQLLGAQHLHMRKAILCSTVPGSPNRHREKARAAPLPRTNVDPGSLSAIVRAFKSASTRLINELRGSPGAPVWQRNYYERIIRTESDLAEKRRYVLENPLKWAEDPHNPSNWRSF